MAKYLVNLGQHIESDSPIIAYVENEKDYFEYIDSIRVASEEAQLIASINEEKNNDSIKLSKPLNLILLKAIKNLIHEGLVENNSGN